LKAEAKKVERVCETCGRVFYVKPHVLKYRRAAYCSRICYNLRILNVDPVERSPLIEKKCVACGRIFYTKVKHAKACSRKCGKEYLRLVKFRKILNDIKPFSDWLMSRQKDGFPTRYHEAVYFLSLKCSSSKAKKYIDLLFFKRLLWTDDYGRLVFDEQAYQSTNMVLDSTLGPDKVLKTED
jgi:hypothetical protein